MDSPGFLGTQATMLRDVTLLVEIGFYLVLCAGVAAQLKGQYKWHDWLQTPVVLLNLAFIGLVMLPAFSGVTGQLPGRLNDVPVMVPVIHGLLGTIAQGLAIYCLLAGLKYLPRKIGILRYWMWAAFVAWTATVFFGVSTYVIWYAAPTSPTPTEPVSEHDAALVEPTTTEEAVPDTSAEEIAEELAEHAEVPVELVEQEPTAETIDSPSNEALIGEHAEEDEMASMIDDHEAELPEIVTPEFAGEMVQAEWQQLQPVNTGPGLRYEQALYYHSPSQQLFLFGGREGNQIYNDTWVLDVESLTWRELAADSATKPPARYSLVMIVDTAGENLYIATGHAAGGQNFNDMWRLDLQTESWDNLTTEAGSPPAERYGNPGGNINDNLVLTHGFGSRRYDDTWQFNTTTEQWENITPAGDKPLLRCLFAATPADGDLVIHGGCATPNGPCFLDDTWLLDMSANQWREVTSEVKPVGRQHQTLVATEANQLILFGGQDATRAPRDDVWLLNLSTEEWQKIDAPDGPTARYNHAAVWLPDRQAMWLYGGQDGVNALGDLWQLMPQP